MARKLFRNNAFVEYSGSYFLIGLLALVLLVIDRNTNIFAPIHRSIEQTLLSVHSLLYTSHTEFGNGFAMLTKREQLIKNITELTRERDKLATQIAMTIPHLEQENQQLRDLLNLTASTNDNILIAEQIRSISSNQKQLLAINVGTKDAVRLTLPVLSSQGVLGQIVEVFSDYSLVLPIVHRTHALSVQVRGKPQRYIAHGNGKQLVITTLPARTKLTLGDQIISTGLGGVYPQFYPVGEVVSVQETDDNHKQAFIEPYTDFGGVRFAMVVYQRLVTNDNL